MSAIASVEDISAFLSYCPTTGMLTWKQKPPRSRVVAGSVAGQVGMHGYVILMFRKRNYRAHRIGWALTHGKWPAMDIDHINGNRADNRLANLREINDLGNQQNRTKFSKFPGSSVSSKNTFRASIWSGGKQHRLGYFKTREEAARAYLKAKAELHASQNAELLSRVLSSLGPLPEATGD